MKRSDPVFRGSFRALALVLLLLLVLIPTLSSCTEEKAPTVEPADENEAIAAAERLVTDAAIWVRLFFTEGGMPLLAGGREVGVYREVDGEAMRELGFSRLSDIRAYGGRIFTPSMCRAMNAALFSGGGNWNAALIENTSFEVVTNENGEPVDTRTVFLCLLADPDELPMIKNDGGTFDFTKASVTDNRGDFVKVSVPVYGTGENEGKTVTKILNLRLIEGVWYLDNYPNVVFPAGEN